MKCWDSLLKIDFILGLGTVLQEDDGDKWATVHWDRGEGAIYRNGHDGCFDLQPASETPAAAIKTTVCVNLF